MRKIQVFVLAALVLAPLTMCSQDKPVPPPLATAPKTPPVVSEKMRGDLFKAQSILDAAQIALERTAEYQQQKEAAAAFQVEMAKWQSVCGADFQPTVGPDREPACIEKPKSSPEPVKK